MPEIDAFIGGDYIVTVHDGPSRAIDEIEKRLVLNARHFERPDQVLHSIIDIVVDRYLPTLDHIGDTIDKVEDALLINPDITLLETIFDLKRGLLQFRRAVAAQRELLNMLIRDEKMSEGSIDEAKKSGAGMLFYAGQPGGWVYVWLGVFVVLAACPLLAKKLGSVGHVSGLR